MIKGCDTTPSNAVSWFLSLFYNMEKKVATQIKYYYYSHKLNKRIKQNFSNRLSN